MAARIKTGNRLTELQSIPLVKGFRLKLFFIFIFLPTEPSRTNLMPTTTTADNTKAIVTLFQLAEKSRHGGGLGGFIGKLGYTAPGRGVVDVKKPGSRGGHVWTDAHGGVHYGPPPKGRAQGVGAKKPAGVRAGAKPKVAKPMTAHNHPGNFKRATPESKLRDKRRMLTALNKTYRTGVDPHGNPLSEAQLAKVKLLKTALGGELKASRAASATTTKEIAQEITEKAANRLPFTVFKDKAGQWRWIGVSSSAAQDHDGETVSLKALQDDTATKDITGTHGPLNFWHTHLKLGTCDFNAMDGPLLVESGTFVSDAVAVAVSKAISEGSLKPAMSLEFKHNEPGPPVLPGRVFTKINKTGRALLPAEKASNLLTSFKVYSLNSAAMADEKGSKKMLTDEKQKKALEIFGPELLEALSNDNQVAVKMAEAMNLSFKAMTPPTLAVVEAAPVVVEPAPVAAVVESEPAPVVSPAAATAVEPPVAAVTSEEAPLEVDTEAIFETLAQSVADKILAGQAAATATSSKEVSEAVGVMTVALKENTAALNQVVAENVALKARLDALEGLQPAQVRARASQQGGLPLDQLAEKDRELVDPAKKEIDPYERIVQQLGLIPVSQR